MDGPDHGARKDHTIARGAEEHQHKARREEEPSRTVQQEEAERPPPVAHGAEVRRMRDPPILVQRDGNLGDVALKEAGLDQHLRRELHSGAAEVQVVVEVAPERAHAAVDVAHRHIEPHVGHAGEHGIAEPAVRRRHGTGHDRSAAARQPAALHDVVALLQLVVEITDDAEVVTVVRIAHEYPFASRRRDAPAERVAVAALAHVHHTSAEAAGDLLRTISAAVVSDDDLTADTAGLQRRERLLDADGEGVLLVQAGHHDRQLEIGCVSRRQSGGRQDRGVRGIQMHAL